MSSMAQKLNLHIGHGKTGTSAIQSYFAINSHHLEEQGICYPKLSDFSHSRAAQKKVSSGNLRAHSEGDQANWCRDQVLSSINSFPGFDSYIFSNETIFHHMNSFFNCLDEFTDLSITPIVHLSVRNPVEMIESEYQQLVKRHGYCDSIDDFVASRGYKCIHAEKSARLLEMLEQNGVDFRVYNYSLLKGSIINCICEGMGIDISGFEDLGTVVNRSMSASELQLLILTNRLYGEQVSAQISTRLVEEVDFIERDTVKYGNEAVAKLREVNQPFIQLINKYLPRDAGVQLDEQEGGCVLNCEMNEQQINIIKSILPEKQDHSGLGSAIAKIALSLNKVDNQAVKSKVLDLMHIAQKLHPSGPVIDQFLGAARKD